MLRILAVAPLEWNEGIEYLLVAIRKLLNMNTETTLVLIGDGPERQRMLYTLFDLEIEHCVQWLAGVPEAGLEAYFSRADVFVSTSLTGPNAGVLRRAAAVHLPVVTTSGPGAPQIKEADLVGLVVPVRDPDALAEVLHRLANSPLMRERLGTTGLTPNRLFVN